MQTVPFLAVATDSWPLPFLSSLFPNHPIPYPFTPRSKIANQLAGHKILFLSQLLLFTFFPNNSVHLYVIYVNVLLLPDLSEISLPVSQKLHFFNLNIHLKRILEKGKQLVYSTDFFGVIFLMYFCEDSLSKFHHQHFLITIPFFHPWLFACCIFMFIVYSLQVCMSCIFYLSF